MKKSFKKIIVILLAIICIGITIPLYFSLVHNDDNIPFEIRAEARLSIPKLLKLITIYQSFSKQDDGTIIAGTHTLFNIKLQEIIFNPATDETRGSVEIDYPLFGQ
ncbi:MAG: hypothetical protein Q8P20_10840 [bacterium]|nr:hypothetical protein [bacterium]